MDTKSDVKLISIASLAGVSAIAAAVLGYLYHSHAEKIAANRHAYDLRLINEVLDNKDYDNDVFSDLIWVDNTSPDAQLLGNHQQHFICRARQQGKPRAAILQVSAKNGYSGEIHLMVGVYYDGSLAGVRVTRHQETPGLGDQIERSRSSWIEQFKGRSLNDPTADKWSVKKDGGEFDQITGATVSPRAVTNAVKNALEYFALHRDAIFSDGPAAKNPANE